MKNNKDFIFAVGKRKESVARLRLYSTMPDNLNLGEQKIKKGDIFVNGKKIEDYFRGIIIKPYLEDPLKSTNSLEKYFISVKVQGGGKKGQLDALVHALSRTLSLDPKNRQILKKKGLLTRDSRVRERRKVGMGGKARRKRQSPKR